MAIGVGEETVVIDSNVINAYRGMLCSITVGQPFREGWLPRAKTRIVISTIFVAVCLVGAIAYQSTFLTSYGFGVEIPFVNTTFYEGPRARALNGTDLSWLVGLVITVPLYYFSASRRFRAEIAPQLTAAAG